MRVITFRALCGILSTEIYTFTVL